MTDDLITDEMVIASMRARCRAECGGDLCAAGCVAEDFLDDPDDVATVRAMLSAALPVIVRGLSEKMRDYRVAEAQARHVDSRAAARWDGAANALESAILALTPETTP